MFVIKTKRMSKVPDVKEKKQIKKLKQIIID